MELSQEKLLHAGVKPTVGHFVNNSKLALRHDVPALVRWSFLLFTFSIPFEHLNAVKFTSMLFFPLYLFYYNPLFKNTIYQKRYTHAVERPIWWFAGYVIVFGMHTISKPESVGRLVSLSSLILFLWIASELLRERKLAREAIFAYSVGASIVAVTMLLRVPGVYTEFIGEAGIRISAFNQNPNIIAMIFVLATLMLVGLYLRGIFIRVTTQCVLVCLIAPLLMGIVATGSRTAVVALIAGFVVYIVPSNNTKRKKIAAAVMLFGTMATVYLIVSDPVFMARVEETIYEGKTAGRDNITQQAVEMIGEYPIFGWGPGAFSDELGFRTGLIFNDRDAHNSILHLLLEVGAVGTIPFLIGIWLCCLRAWKARVSDYGPMPVSLLVALIITTMGQTLISQKPIWFVLACVLGASASLRK